jgi:hypothetical protein
VSAVNNRGRVVVNRDGNWRLYTYSLPAGCTVFGTVTRDEIETGALVKTKAGIYSMLKGRVYKSLDQRKVLSALGEPLRPVGRPSEMTDGRRVQVYLDAASLATAATLANGNVSEGIRLALARAARQRKK